MDNHHAPGPGPMSVPVPGSSANPPKAADDDGISSLPAHTPPKSLETTDDTRLYRLVCVQQPRRARMCGFGDKDRRPITPPPCIRLTVIEKATGQEVGCNDIEHQMFVLSVDLWTYDGRREVNLVRHSQNSPSISSTTQTSFRELQEAGGPAQYETHTGVASMGGRGQGYAPAAPHYGQSAVYGAPSYGQGPPADSYSYAGHVGQYHIPHSQMGGHALPPLPSPSAANGFPGRPGPDLGRTGHLPTQQHNGYASRYAQDLGPQRAAHLSTQQNTGMYTRNLIGSLVTSAARLIDDNEKDGIWFVLQDLSVRTEGFFRLRFSFTSVGVPNTSGDSTTSDPQRVNKGKAPVLAMCFSEPFQVYSAKKFPGVCESTSLSKCFANQGIKIPIRKEGEGKGKRRVGSDDEEEY